MKGIANWIIVMGSIAIGATIFFISATLIIKQMKISEKQTVLEQMQDFYIKLKDVCNSGKGTIFYYKIALSDNVKSIYVSNSSYEAPPDKVSSLITDKESATGNYSCIYFFSDNLPICEKIGCITKLTYIGTPSMKMTLKTLLASLKNQDPIYEYNIKIEKVDDYLLNATVENIKSFKPTTTTSITTTTVTMPTTGE